MIIVFVGREPTRRSRLYNLHKTLADLNDFIGIVIIAWWKDFLFTKLESTIIQYHSQWRQYHNCIIYTNFFKLWFVIYLLDWGLQTLSDYNIHNNCKHIFQKHKSAKNCANEQWQWLMTNNKYNLFIRIHCTIKMSDSSLHCNVKCSTELFILSTTIVSVEKNKVC